MCTVASLGGGEGADRPGWHPPKENKILGKFTTNSGHTRSDR